MGQVCTLFSLHLSRVHYRPIYTSEAGSVQRFKVLAWEHMHAVGLESKSGRGRKRGPKSSGNGNIEESPTCLFPPPATEVEANLGSVFPNASHSYCSLALLPFPFGLLFNWFSRLNQTMHLFG
ncbi:hypothetical protein PAHAL_7G154400 [Panicum hallii]|uniref:Uncharacterized protein n=1 Tax=Panicum hallii TaxID=206008 RepID=A0A2T8ICD2_9POAL|nr:hypothetical protein PAHAL_7G154400 [Panicum hallii]